MHQRLKVNNARLAKKILLVALTALAVSLPRPTQAHDLLPKAIVEYLAANPGATPQEIRDYARATTPEFGEKLKDHADVVRLVTDRQTSFVPNLWDFIKLGTDHILAGPDHVLFVLTLVLVFASLKEILQLTGTFTLAHSITLILAGTGVVVISPNIVEPLIALSIACVAYTSVFVNKKNLISHHKGKLLLIFLFGIFHGLGFAGLLNEIQIPPERFVSSLVGFNLGIELGQLIILGFILPPIYYFRDKTWYGKSIRIMAVCIIVISLCWFAQRIFI